MVCRTSPSGARRPLLDSSGCGFGEVPRDELLQGPPPPPPGPPPWKQAQLLAADRSKSFYDQPVGQPLAEELHTGAPWEGMLALAPDPVELALPAFMDGIASRQRPVQSPIPVYQ
mmetsp:Transcript_111703/g.238621  ORF Transcript_111703/g.238621 Transcript_111703/m.238621 type:complete len:115 (+) Transcript_111703:210-554(+)